MTDSNDIPPHYDAEALSGCLASVLEQLEHMQQQERPYLVGLYQTHLGESEYRLLALQVECRGLQRRIEMMTAHLNRGEALTWQKLEAIKTQVGEALRQWQAHLEAQAQTLAAGKAYLAGLVAVDAKAVLRAKAAYRRLARLLHPDASPHNQGLFARYWPSVQEAYASADADLLEALLHVVEAAVQTTWDTDAAAGQVARLEALLSHHCQRLADLRGEAPFCWAAQLHDPEWLALRQSELETAINAESGRWAILVARETALSARIPPEP
jgi:hypothetical protein